LLVGVVSLQALGLTENLAKRFNNDDSFIWRLEQYQRLLGAVEPDKLLVGHGHTAALVVIQRFVYNAWNIRDNVQESPYVHNGFLETFYDYGLFALLWLIGFLVCAYKHGKALLDRSTPAWLKSLHISCLALFLVQMIQLSLEEVFFIAFPLSIWSLWAIQYFVATRLKSQENQG
jgi:uncharacterized membrane protein YhdT